VVIVILLFAVLIGMVFGLTRSYYYKRPFSLPELRFAWLVPLAFVPQWLIFYWPLTHLLPTHLLAAWALVISQVLLLLFTWANRRLVSFWVFGIGLALNLLVISLNGGLMPVSPETVQQIMPATTVHQLTLGSRVGSSKDVLLLEQQTYLAWLSDRFILPDWIPYKVAFSLGDVLIALGAFWLLWTAGDQAKIADPS
jgi:hypothetical protein